MRLGGVGHRDDVLAVEGVAGRAGPHAAAAEDDDVADERQLGHRADADAGPRSAAPTASRTPRSRRTPAARRPARSPRRRPPGRPAPATRDAAGRPARSRPTRCAARCPRPDEHRAQLEHAVRQDQPEEQPGPVRGDHDAADEPEVGGVLPQHVQRADHGHAQEQRRARPPGRCSSRPAPRTPAPGGRSSSSRSPGRRACAPRCRAARGSIRSGCARSHSHITADTATLTTAVPTDQRQVR